MDLLKVVAAVVGTLIVVVTLRSATKTFIVPRGRTEIVTNVALELTMVLFRPFMADRARFASRSTALALFAPIALLVMYALWLTLMSAGFSLIYWSDGVTPLLSAMALSGSSLFTLGYDAPAGGLTMLGTIVEAGIGLFLIALLIGYLPTIYSAFSRREVEIALLDARAGSPPTAAELLRRYCQCPPHDGLDRIFHAWERWSAEVLESHLSYPVLSFFRSQHNNQSWLAALTTILDATALVMVGVEGIASEQAKMTFAVARHAVVDLSQVVLTRYDPLVADRLPPEELVRLRQALSDKGLKLRAGHAAEEKLAALRALYEPYVNALARSLLIVLPPWLHAERKLDNWQVAPWDEAVAARGGASVSPYHSEDHF